jgi:hypothetical protein
LRRPSAARRHRGRTRRRGSRACNVKRAARGAWESLADGLQASQPGEPHRAEMVSRHVNNIPNAANTA